ncbi:uncharacterized protein LOC124112432 [Haliotis rufescens]|uniref:uncharacterized protein LOC124112432 n=1 Tax=Haliotis rufescens TaxID=6454 RepID=UPI00201F5488|nr:uncharacterized protein LOC124112432 [Haliotis rufescens]
MASQYLLWSVPKLKCALFQRKASTAGRKLELIERLESYDRNDDFVGPSVSIPRPDDTSWPVSGFQQLMPSHRQLLPPISKETIEGYFIYRMAGDNQAAHDIKAIEKGYLMFEGDRVLACSVNIRASTDVYLSGIVSASMKNKVTYNYKLKVEKTGEPVNSHCECPAGKGPHSTCKHIAAVLLMLEHFISTGSVQVGKSCTENLQLFHKPKKSYKGSPVTAAELPSKRKWSQHMLDDPRPQKYRHMSGYNDHVRNMMTNYCAKSSHNIALRYVHPKADVQTAAEDHHYLKQPFTEYMVDMALKVTEESAKDIEAATQDQSRSPVWHTERKWRLTASRFGEVTKMTNRRNKEKLCKSIVSTKFLSCKPVIHGKQYEKRALSKFESMYNIKTKKAGLFVSCSEPYLGATPDAIIDADILVEVKCPYAGRNDHIKPGKHFPYLHYNVNNQICLNPSSHYYCQVQGQMYLAKRQFCYFVVYTFCDMFVEKVSVDKDFCQYSLIPKLELFYTKHLRPYIASTL